MGFTAARVTIYRVAVDVISFILLDASTNS